MRELRRLDLLFEISLLALVVVPFAMIALGGGVGPVMGGFFAAGLVAATLFHHRGLARPEHARLWNIVIVGWVAIAGVDLLTTDTAILDAGINVVLVLTLIKLFSRLSERDEMQVYALSFLLLAAATAVNEDLTFGILFGLYVLVGTFSLAIFHLRSELRQRPRLALYGRLPLNSRYMAVLAAISALILSASLTIFFAFPRIGLGFFRQQARDGVSMAGFNDRVELGGHGTIRDNPQVVMRVEFPAGRWPDTDSIHWRTMTFDAYDGRIWSRSWGRRDRWVPPVDRRTYSLRELHPSSGTRGSIQIYLEPLGTNLLPVPWPTEQIRLGTEEFLIPWGPRAGMIKSDSYGDIKHTVQNEVGIAYVLQVGTPLAIGEKTQVELEPPRDGYLDTPALTQRVQDLARRAAGAEGTSDERAARIQQFLQDNYSYTLDQKNVGEDPLDSFLFETKSGHCEYFATSMVMMLRVNRIPARLVNGFLGGRWNEVGNYLAVRQGDAHSWVEYWSEGRGWVPIDPTPAADVLNDTSLVDSAREYWDAMRLSWMKWVIEYDLTAQIEFFRRAAQVLEPKGLTGGSDQEGQEPEERQRDWSMALIIGACATVVFVVLRWGRRRRRGTRSDFDRVEAAAARAGFPRRPDEGPAAFLERLATALPDLAHDLERFAAWYLRARFSGTPPTTEEAGRLASVATRVIRALKSNKTAP